MTATALACDPEARPTLLRALTLVPNLLYRLVRWKALRGGWLAGHLARQRSFDRRRLPPDAPIDVMVLVADHFEPARRFGDQAAAESVRAWCQAYQRLASQFRDSDGRPPQHTWFYRQEYPNEGCLQALGESAFRGFGEVEFHLHHGHDSHDSFAEALERGLAFSHRHGAMLTAGPRPRARFAYVAGNSALDNGAGDDSLSGCDTELAALREAGCFADFTFPSLGSPAQPRLTNTIYYAREDGQPKSYDRGVPVRVGTPPSGDLMIFQGPVAFHWDAGRVDDGAVENCSPAHPRRLAPWLSANVHVEGRPEWVFVKLHTHAMQNRVSFLGEGMRSTLEAMQEWWDRPPFRLHYVTAREAYNIVKAAEMGRCGNPGDYRDFIVPRPANRVVMCDRPWRLVCHAADRCEVELLRPGPARLELAHGPVRRIEGDLAEVEVHMAPGTPPALRLEGKGPFHVYWRQGGCDRVPGGWWRGGTGLLDTSGRRQYSTALREAW
jgi:hypothetical protein